MSYTTDKYIFTEWRLGNDHQISMYKAGSNDDDSLLALATINNQTGYDGYVIRDVHADRSLIVLVDADFDGEEMEVRGELVGVDVIDFSEKNAIEKAMIECYESYNG